MVEVNLEDVLSRLNAELDGKLNDANQQAYDAVIASIDNYTGDSVGEVLASLKRQLSGKLSGQAPLEVTSAAFRVQKAYDSNRDSRLREDRGQRLSIDGPGQTASSTSSSLSIDEITKLVSRSESKPEIKSKPFYSLLFELTNTDVYSHMFFGPDNINEQPAYSFHGLVGPNQNLKLNYPQARLLTELKHLIPVLEYGSNIHGSHYEGRVSTKKIEGGSLVYLAHMVKTKSKMNRGRSSEAAYAIFIPKEKTDSIISRIKRNPQVMIDSFNEVLPQYNYATDKKLGNKFGNYELKLASNAVFVDEL